ncbi:MAG: cyclic nucleotide-binding domain-containing protein [Treponema sp.]|nr:cyclic nucleotide-binding domain-containing protein [Treponema sp.]
MPKQMAYKPGNIIFFAGDKDDRIFILQSGSVELKAVDIRTKMEVKETVKQGEFFGVKNALVHKPRTDTARAMSDCLVVMLTVQEFENTISRNKELMEKMMVNFSKTLRSIHYDTESQLNNEEMKGEKEEKLLAIAKAYFNAERYATAVNEAEKILQEIPEAVNKSDVQNFLAEARVKASAMAEQEMLAADSSQELLEADSMVIKQFSAPVFSRFTKKFSDGAIIMSEYTSAKSFYFVQSGKVVIEKYINGVMKRYGVIRPGEIFGDMEILQESPRQSSAIAKGSVTCLKFSKENFNSVVISSPNVAMLMLRLICKRIFEQRRNLQILCIKDLSARIADIMLMCIENEGAVGADEDDMKRKINVTVDDIAMIAGLSVNSTRDELNKFTSKNKIAIYDGYMIVANVMDMKRTVDTYYTNLEEEEAKQKQQQQAKK